MEAVDNRSKIFELDEIYKYKNLINNTDKQIIKEIICTNDDKSVHFYAEFINLVTKEVDHVLNKAEFEVHKNKLIIEMKEHLNSK
ncbi:MAG: hypothetical protein HOB26_10675 [Flavobacteriales bacterium]|jgi:hypothetical protein|nr:hypothetical protein [Flavobacteriales bacterium]MBT6747008.1 hypothetical protein [Flavobacteriales bacterium]